MAKTLTGSVRISSSLTLAKTSVNNITDISVSSSPTSFSKSYNTATGTSTGANELYDGVRLISASGYDVLDLVGGSLINVVNDSGITFARVKSVSIQLLSADDNSTYGNSCSGILVRPHSASPFKLWHNTTVNDPDGGVLIENSDIMGWATGKAAGRATSASFGDSIMVKNLDGSVTAAYRLVILGSDS